MGVRVPQPTKRTVANRDSPTALPRFTGSTTRLVAWLIPHPAFFPHSLEFADDVLSGKFGSKVSLRHDRARMPHDVLQHVQRNACVDGSRCKRVPQDMWRDGMVDSSPFRDASHRPLDAARAHAHARVLGKEVAQQRLHRGRNRDFSRFAVVPCRYNSDMPCHLVVVSRAKAHNFRQSKAGQERQQNRQPLGVRTTRPEEPIDFIPRERVALEWLRHWRKLLISCERVVSI